MQIGTELQNQNGCKLELDGLNGWVPREGVVAWWKGGLGARQEMSGPPVEEQWSRGGKPVAMGLRQRMRCVPMGQRHLHEKIGGGVGSGGGDGPT